MKLDHITAIVADPRVGAVFARLLGSEPCSVQLPGMSIATFGLAGAELHVNAPTGPGPVDDHFRTHGASLHHVAFEVDSLESELASLAERGFRAKGTPVATAPGLREVFLDPETTGGIWIQLVERSGSVNAVDLDAEGVGALVGSARAK